MPAVSSDVRREVFLLAGLDHTLVFSIMHCIRIGFAPVAVARRSHLFSFH